MYSAYYYGCVSGILSCLVIYEGVPYLIKFIEYLGKMDIDSLFVHMQLAPFRRIYTSGSDTDGYEEGSEDENEKED